MEDLIIILLGLAAAGYSAFRKNRKAKEEGASGTSRSRTADAYSQESETDRDYIEEFFGDEAYNTATQEQLYSEVNEGQQRFRNPRLGDASRQEKFKEEDTFANTGKNDKSTFNKRYNESINTKKYDYQPAGKKREQAKYRQNSRNKSIHHRFDLRRAVIYSEILNRKY